MCRSGSETCETSTRAAVRSGFVRKSSMSMASPFTLMPSAISAARNADAKNPVGLSTEAVRTNGAAFAGICPSTTSARRAWKPLQRERAGSRLGDGHEPVVDLQPAAIRPHLNGDRIAGRGAGANDEIDRPFVVLERADRLRRSRTAGCRASSRRRSRCRRTGRRRPMMPPSIRVMPASRTCRAMALSVPGMSLRSLMLGSPPPTTTRSPRSTPSSMGRDETTLRLEPMIPAEQLGRGRQR